MSKPITPVDLIALGYSPSWVGLAWRIAAVMHRKAAHQAVIKHRELEAASK